MLKGTVKFFNAAKGFGFITPDEGDKDVFLPGPTVVSAGISGLTTGQRVSFTTEPEGKGPKAVSLVLLAETKPQNAAIAPAQRPLRNEPKPTLTFYHDPDWDTSERALAQLLTAGYEPRIVEYLTSPPARDELKHLSVLLQSNGQSLVKRYDRLFLELRLDDRFISENDFWDTIVEHPALINGPVVATSAKASVCQSENAVTDFLSDILSAESQTAPKPKKLSERALRMLAGEIVLPPAANENLAASVATRPASASPVKPERAPEAIVKVKSNPVAKVKVATGHKSTTKTKVPATKVAGKPAKKPLRAVASKKKRVPQPR